MKAIFQALAIATTFAFTSVGLSPAAAQTVFPPATGKNDAAAAKLTANLQLSATIPDDDPLQSNGNTELAPKKWTPRGLLF